MYTGKELKIRRIILDIDAKDVAEMIGIHRSYVCKLEKEVQPIPEHIYDKWIKVLGLE